jgi:hypothetical protein
MKFRILILFAFIPILLIGQSKTSVCLNINYPLLDNKNNTLTNSVKHSSLFEEVMYFERPGLSIQATHEMPFIFETFFSFGLGLDWVNYNLDFNETNIIPQNIYERDTYNPLIEKYSALDPSFKNTILYASIPINCTYPILDKKLKAGVGLITNIQLYSNQKCSFQRYISFNGVSSVEKQTINTDEGINKLLLLLNIGCEYNLNDDLSITFDYKVGLTPIYKSNYTLVGNSALNVFSLGVKYCFLR